MKSDKRVEWERAAHAEIDSLEANDTWELVSRTKEMRPLHTKWVFQTKTDADENIERYKARMVACGNEQSFGKDYTLTFAAVMDMTTGKVILVLSQVWRVPARHDDVPNAYVKVSTEPDLNIYLYVPQEMKVSQTEIQRLGVEHAGQVVLQLKQSLYGLKQAGQVVLQLKQSLYGLKQAGRLWPQLLHALGAITRTSQKRVDEVFDLLTTLQIKDLGVVSKFLGMRITHSAKFGYELDQEVTIAERFRLQDAHSAMTPIELSHDNNTREADALLPKESTVGSASVQKFQSIVGSLLWLARCTRPDIAYAVHRATRRTDYKRLAVIKENRQVPKRHHGRQASAWTKRC
ncbi:unnamed protein product [Peronospora destructor]|uniref:Reverse transcriptase Ty1/copia-type domain-containing protein n=1 Tax=Peronospora destructor TaxID=86335 RepID=A0AAV0VFG5_9STRA|nr:unnamed protein product [Peronospora destructor]